jgi:hypothetical protein
MCNIERRFEEYLFEYNSIDMNHSKLNSSIVDHLASSIMNDSLNSFNWFPKAWFSDGDWIKTSSIVDPLNWFPKAWFSDGHWIKAYSATPAPDWMDWFERAWFDEVEKAHNNKAVEKAHYTVAKEMENPHKDDGFNPHKNNGSAPQRLDSDTGHTEKPHTVKDVDPVDNTNSSDWINPGIASGGEWIKALDYTATKAPNSNGLDMDIPKGLNKVAIMILEYLYDSGNGLGQSNKLPYDPGGLDQSKRLPIQMDQPKRALIQMENGPATKRHKVQNRSDTNSGLLTRSTNKSSLTRNISALNQHAPVKWYDAIDGICMSDRDGIG